MHDLKSQVANRIKIINLNHHYIFKIINLHGTHVSNSRVATAKTKRCPVQGQENAKQPIAF